jgi:SAM-dependent methyltransferase
MENRFRDRPIGEHDWHSQEYVHQLIERDVTRDNERRPLLQQMLTIAPFAHDAEIGALDVGAGYGLVSEQVLRAFSRARLTLLDYSEPMFEHARKRLALRQSQVSYVLSDLRDPGWTNALEGPFDLVVSGLAIHNLREPSLMQACYCSICKILRPTGIFLDYDLFGLVASGTTTHCQWMREAGFERTQCTWEEPPLGIIAAWLS